MSVTHLIVLEQSELMLRMIEVDQKNPRPSGASAELCIEAIWRASPEMFARYAAMATAATDYFREQLKRTVVAQ